MAAIKVHGVNYSAPVMRVLACLHEKELEFEFISVDWKTGVPFSEQKKEPYISLNPFGLVPAFEEGDLKLFESRAITKYIAEEYSEKGTQLIFQDSKKKKAILSVWMEVEAHQFDPEAQKLTLQLAVKPNFLDEATDAAVVEECEAKLAKVLDVYETRLSQTKYLVGDSFTLADLNHLPNIQYMLETQSKKLIDSRPHVKAWVADITSRPSWLKVVALKNNKE